MKRLILGLVIGMLIGSAATAFAASDTVTATIAKLRFVVNGEERDVQTEQLVVMGTTYLPVREVANMLGYDVVYRSDSKTVEFNTANDSTKKGDRQDMDHTTEEITNESTPHATYEGTDIVLDFDFGTLDMSEWTSLYDIRDDVRWTVNVLPNSRPSDYRRLLVIESEASRIEFVVPNIIGGNKLFRNADGDELLLTNDEMYIRNETVARLLGQ
jgi:Copper amine oxidase N-terminal domain.